MGTFFAPSIEAEHFEAFRRIPTKDLPDTYNAWLYRCLKERTEREGPGQIVREVKIDPDEFIAFCRATNTKPSTDALDRMAYDRRPTEEY